MAAQTSPLAVSEQAIAEMKRLIDKAGKVEGQLKVQRGAFAEQLKAHGATLETQLQAHADELEQIKKAAVAQTLQWAISNAEIGQFIFYDRHGIRNSKDILRLALLSFMEGRGMWLPDDCGVSRGQDPSSKFSLLDERQAFRDALSNQVHQLTGVRPRIVKEKQGNIEQYAIYRV